MHFCKSYMLGDSDLAKDLHFPVKTATAVILRTIRQGLSPLSVNRRLDSFKPIDGSQSSINIYYGMRGLAMTKTLLFHKACRLLLNCTSYHQLRSGCILHTVLFRISDRSIRSKVQNNMPHGSPIWTVQYVLSDASRSKGRIL